MSRPVERLVDVFSTGDSSGAELCAYILKSLAETAMVFMARFDGVHAFSYNSAGSEAIWMKIAWRTLSILFAAGPGKRYVAVSHLSNYIEPFVYGGDAPYVKLLSPLVIFGRPYRQSHR